MTILRDIRLSAGAWACPHHGADRAIACNPEGHHGADRCVAVALLAQTLDSSAIVLACQVIDVKYSGCQFVRSVVSSSCYVQATLLGHTHQHHAIRLIKLLTKHVSFGAVCLLFVITRMLCSRTLQLVCHAKALLSAAVTTGQRTTM